MLEAAMPKNLNLVLKVLLLYIVGLPLIHGDCSTPGQPPRFILEPQDAVLPISRGSNPVPASIHCSHDSPNTTLTWYRNGAPMVYDANRVLHPNGTLEFKVLIDRADVSVGGIEYYCQLSNAFGSIISRTALLQSATFDETAWPSNPVITNTMIDVTLGSFIMIPCNPPAANPPPVIEWTRNGTVLVPGDTSKYKVLSTEAGGGLIIANVAAGDIGPTYRCRVTNVFVFSSRDSPNTHQLNQINRYPQDLIIYDTIDPMYRLPTGSNAEFTCLALANDVSNLEFLYRRIDTPAIPNNVMRTTHDATTIVGRTTMRITRVTQANAGVYQCVVRDNDPQGNAILLGNTNFTIQVSVPPAITTVPGDQVFYTGDTHTLTCGATGFPAPVISYYFNATLITTGVSDGVLTLTGVTAAANTGPYQCFADNVRADSSALWVVTIRDPTPPVMLGTSAADATVAEGVNITLTIDVSADPAPTATWTLNDDALPSTATPTLKVIDASACPGTYQAVLTVTGFADAHSGTYKVTVMNRAGSFTHSFQRVKEVPAFVTSLTGTGTSNNCITRGQDSSLTCIFGGIPQPTSLWYTLSGDDDSVRINIPVSDADYVVLTSATQTILTVRTVNDGDNVKYVCEATNTVNGTVRMGKMEKKFDICSMPTFSTKPRDVEAIEMDEVTFNCNGEGEPAVTYEWFFTNTSGVTVQINDMTKDQFNIMIADDHTFITIDEVMKENEGEYTCQITTPLGQMSSSATLTVDPLLIPATVSNLTATATDDNCTIRGQDIVLTCRYDGVPQPSVLWYTLTGDSRVNIPASDADYVVTITPTEAVLTIHDVDSEDVGTYGCEATNTVNGSVIVNNMEIDVIICMTAESSAGGSSELTTGLIILLSILATIIL